ncbi:MAG TPA: 16S rRNA (cytidine(1402)-2'-O)-methyltransferase [Calditrichaeota bacterium]|nr:16S rRNA (cytidine(1402)-2'-O)-methyltransferase [Calditrichota bacterium]
MEEILPGTLYLVATPIGNLADITYRAVHILNNVDLIAAEDTRQSRILLNHYLIKTPLVSYHSYNLMKQTPQLIRRLKAQQSIALISDAGTPGISDPGYQLVQSAIEEHIRIVPIPGASALLTALVASGLPTNRFVYEGFLPLKKGRKTRLQQLALEERTIVLYESPHRIQKTIGDILDIFGDRPCVLARELTKLYEELLRGTLSGFGELLKTKKLKGEIVLIIAGKGKKGKARENE